MSCLASDSTSLAVPGLTARGFFPIFGDARYTDKPLCYLDSAASSQKPQVVIDRLIRYLSYEHANIHRGAYRLSAEATQFYDEARRKIAAFLNAPCLEGTIFTRGTTESINLVARSLERWFRAGDVILLTILEHHSNIVPWQMLADRLSLKLVFADCHSNASLNIHDFERKLMQFHPRLVAATQLSNSFGAVTPIKEMIDKAHETGAKILVDGAQSIPHARLDLSQLGCDFFAFSGHKVYGPTGIGGLIVTKEMLQLMEPFNGGGDMIASVSVEGSTWADPPQKFEAGTPPIAEAIALGTALDFVSGFDREAMAAHERELFAYAFERLSREPGVEVYGPATTGGDQRSIISFNVKNIHPHDLASVADSFNVQFRAGHHCAMPALKRLGLPSTARISFGVYSAPPDVDALLEAIRHARKIFG